MPHRLFFFPDYQLTNPYQSLLYAHLHDAFFAEAASLDRAIQHLASGPDGRTLFHLHWEDAILSAAADGPAAERAAQGFLDQLQGFVDDGGIVVWTLHNLRPHRPRFQELEDELRRALAAMAQLVQVNSHAAVEVALGLGVDWRRLAVVPHGNYRPALRPAATPRQERRAALGVGDDERLLAHFGRLLPYKGTAQLIEALEALPSDPCWRLLLAGAFAEAFERAKLPAAVAGRTVVRAGPLEHHQLADLVDAADIAVLPYQEVLTSGATMLALSLGRPVVLPGLDTLREVVADGREAWLYPPEQGTAGLVAALGRALTADEMTLDEMGRAALRSAARYDWRILGAQFGDALLRAIGDASRRPRPLPPLAPL
jgi:glycosyltransferase involved in cell wall biosynthesis